MLLRSRIVLPVTAPPIEDGAVFVSGDRIGAIGPWADFRPHASGPVHDLGEVVLLPGLVNAHCHLDYTELAGALPPPPTFTGWLRSVLALKESWGPTDFARSWRAGAAQLLASGCTTVLDFEAVPELLPEAWDSTPLRVVSALEMTGVRSGRAPGEILGDALRHADRLRPARGRTALGPHAPYSTRPELVRLAAEAARARGLVVTMHVAESADECAMFEASAGAMFEWLRELRDTTDCGTGSPVRWAERCGLLGPNCVLAHVNHLVGGDAGRIAASGSSVVHCPRSHDYFGHSTFPFDALRSAGVRTCLGTDSALSLRPVGADAPTLDMFAELALFAARHPHVEPAQILRMATVDGAAALGAAGDFGELRQGRFADMIAIPFAGNAGGCTAAVVQYSGPVRAAMIGGAWVLDAGDGSPGTGGRPRWV